MRALLIGRFQPFHLGHLEAVRRVAAEFPRVIIGIGSAQVSHTLANPFTAGERYRMIEESLEDAGARNVDVLPIPDLNRNALWVAHVESLVPPFDVFFTNNALPRRLFLERGYEVRPLPFHEREVYEGTEIRRLILEDGPWERRVPDAVRRIVREIGGVGRMKDLARDDAPGKAPGPRPLARPAPAGDAEDA